MQQHQCELPRRLYSWAVHVSPDSVGAVGVTDDRARALAHLGDALATAPAGARGEVHGVWLSTSGTYDYGCLLAVGRVDPQTHAVIWWKRLRL